ncbi:MAG: GNAT family N-acetyltransferase [Sporichthyaceae bacterium]
MDAEPAGEEPWVPATRPPELIDAGACELRRWRRGDSAALCAVVEASREHLRPWLPWAVEYELSSADAYTAAAEAAWEDRTHFDYRITCAPGSTIGAAHVLGSVSLMARVGRGALEIGYWVRVDRTRLGIASAATVALTAAGLALPDVERIELHHEVANLASSTVAARAGFTAERDYDGGGGARSRCWSTARAADPLPAMIGQDEGARPTDVATNHDAQLDGSSRG